MGRCGSGCAAVGGAARAWQARGFVLLDAGSTPPCLELLPCSYFLTPPPLPSPLCLLLPLSLLPPCLLPSFIIHLRAPDNVPGSVSSTTRIQT